MSAFDDVALVEQKCNFVLLVVKFPKAPTSRSSPSLQQVLPACFSTLQAVEVGLVHHVLRNNSPLLSFFTNALLTAAVAGAMRALQKKIANLEREKLEAKVSTHARITYSFVILKNGSSILFLDLVLRIS